MTTIYVLKDPVSKEVVYVGQTKRRLSIRLLGHISQTDDSEKTKWIHSLIATNCLPVIEPLENVEDTNACSREAFYIQNFKNQGSSLFNLPVGGFRENAKRPLKYGEQTESVPVRVPKSKKKKFKELIKPILKQWEVPVKKAPTKNPTPKKR